MSNKTPISEELSYQVGYQNSASKGPGNLPLSEIEQKNSYSANQEDDLNDSIGEMKQLMSNKEREKVDVDSEEVFTQEEIDYLNETKIINRNGIGAQDFQMDDLHGLSL